MSRPVKLEEQDSKMDSSRSMSVSSENSNDLGQLQRISRSSANENKVCRVCGDKALSINFNVVTCESCKAFFRRNALKPKVSGRSYSRTRPPLISLG